MRRGCTNFGSWNDPARPARGDRRGRFGRGTAADHPADRPDRPAGPARHAAAAAEPGAGPAGGPHDSRRRAVRPRPRLRGPCRAGPVDLDPAPSRCGRLLAGVRWRAGAAAPPPSRPARRRPPPPWRRRTACPAFADAPTSTDPAMATPSEDPRLDTLRETPEMSPWTASGHADWTRFTDAVSMTPTPEAHEEQPGHEGPDRGVARRTRASSRPRPTTVPVKPTRISSRWGCRLAMRCAIAEDSRMPMVAGSSTRPVWIAEYPRSCCRNTEITKKEPCSTSHCRSGCTSPRFDVRLRNRRERHQRRPAVPLAPPDVDEERRRGRRRRWPRTARPARCRPPG